MPRCLAICLASAMLFACSAGPGNLSASDAPTNRAAKEVRKELRDNIKKIEPFFKPMAKPAGLDWLASHNEPGQTFEQYLDADPVKPTKERQRIYVLPLGKFDARQKKVVDAAADYLGIFYDLPVQQMPTRPLVATQANTRENKITRARQIKTSLILNDILPKLLPADAAALIAFTTDDLYPDDSMNFVFGQASLENRVGVWSLARLGEHADYDTFLRRTLKIAAHETGHMFSMRHCTRYECLMSGTNSLEETDRRPIDACPECSAKIWWISDADPPERYKKLADFCRRNGLANEAADFTRKAAAVSQNR